MHKCIHTLSILNIIRKNMDFYDVAFEGEELIDIHYAQCMPIYLVTFSCVQKTERVTTMTKQEKNRIAEIAENRFQFAYRMHLALKTKKSKQLMNIRMKEAFRAHIGISYWWERKPGESPDSYLDMIE